jgi:spermidine synthase
VIVGFEVIWSRTLAPLLGSTVYAFSAMLAAVLVGLALGSALATRFGDRAPSPQLAFAGLGMLSAVAALATQRLTPELIVPAMGLLEASQDVAWRVAGVPFLLSLALVVLPTLLSGAALPLGIRALAQHNPAATSTGMLYAANTLGSITGALATGLVLIPSIGTARTGAVVALAGASLCTVAAWRVAPRRASPVVWLPLVGALALAATQPAFDVLLFVGGLHMMGATNRALLVRHGIQTRLAGSEVLYLAEGKSTTVLVERRWGRRVFFVDGKPEATDGAEDMRNQYLLAHIPALLHGRVRRSLVVGLGSGMTAGCLTLHGDVHVAELSDIVPDAARMFADLNHDVVRNPRARIFIEDGRTFLKARDETYDVITVDPIHPYVAGAATLYTREYFAAVRSRLREGGIASHWLPLYQLGWDDVTGVLEAFRQTFPDAVVYNTDRDAILVGNAGARLPSAARVAHGFALPGVRADLARVRIETAEQFAALASVGPKGLRQLTRGARPVTDDHTFIEFTAPRWFQHPTHDNLRRILALREPSASGASDAERAARAVYVAQLERVAAPRP